MPLPIPEPRSSGHTVTTAVPLYWAAYGQEGGERLLVLHGGPGASHDYLLPQMLALADERELLFYDQRGGGRSRAEIAAAVTWQDHVDDLEKVVREFRLEPLSILAYSWGALLALLHSSQAFAGAGRTRPARLVLLDPAPATAGYRRDFEMEFARRQQSEPVRAMREELRRSGLQNSDRNAYGKRAFELSVAGYFADPARARDLTPFRVIGRVQQSVWESLGDYDIAQNLRDVSCPALVVHGREDPIPLVSSQLIARALNAELVVLADSGHVPYVERPEELFSAIRRFLADNPSST
ncbi:MAG TPA: alpha/beta hydrolase [Gemmatimonadaceae bacterium]|nr:alpha/beta hydrolase [Gemmatimonadaceae bacterium]